MATAKTVKAYYLNVKVGSMFRFSVDGPVYQRVRGGYQKAAGPGRTFPSPEGLTPVVLVLDETGAK